ncbi:MAG: hypothetical protein AVDCRST_MAG33-1441 [uncultured Thermomicrobiales bacterium]|uniref:Uncharacterized protein n=1 Tax=uncultured Thermomicrobiales bacterium TaxID=1645740 RepID=A0A6J4URX8_9BACT|nr:MAG: hypothetical protein AVDCRST_MAG33-1441 [uncultured Thermomicrobiales bacterium]
MVGRQGGEQHEAADRAEEHGQVRPLFGPADRRELALERQDDQERGQRLDTGQEDPQLAEEIGQVLIAVLTVEIPVCILPVNRLIRHSSPTVIASSPSPSRHPDTTPAPRDQ